MRDIERIIDRLGENGKDREKKEGKKLRGKEEGREAES